MFRDDKYHLSLQVWQELNRKAENAWYDGKTVEFIGADRHEDGRLFAAFQIVNKDGTRGKILCVDNDVTFNFQQNGNKPIERKGYGEGQKGQVSGHWSIRRE